jgi:predicted ferric reductase
MLQIRVELSRNQPAHLFSRNWICLQSAEFFYEKDDEQKDDILLKGFALPLLIVTSLTYLLSEDSQLLIGREKRTLRQAIWRIIGRSDGGDPNITGWTMFIVGLPTTLVAFLPQFRPISDYMDRRGISSPILARLYMLANPAGIAACVALALFLIPVAKHSPVLKTFGLSFTQALAFHRTAGWISLAFTSIHAILYCVRYGIEGQSEGLSFWNALVNALFPPRNCWTKDVFFLSGSPSGCYRYWRNFTGTISAFAFLVLGIASLPRVRRRAYRLFYIIHIPSAWTMMIAAIAHFNFIALFLVPNIVCYLVSTVPVWVSQFHSARNSKGFQIESVLPIEDSNGCYVLRFPQRHLQRTIRTKYGAVCKICVPEISSIWHPFSVILDPNDPNESLLLLIRGAGPFTKSVLERLLSTSQTVTTQVLSNESQDEIIVAEELQPLRPSPAVLFDGLYPAEYRWDSSLLSHDAVLMVAGGVGIVPFLPLLSELHHQLVNSQSRRMRLADLKHLSLHWYCREEGLARYIYGKYLRHLFTEAAINILGGTDMFSDELLDEEDYESQNHTLMIEINIHITSSSIEYDGDDFAQTVLSENNDVSEIKFNDTNYRRLISKPFLSLQSQHYNKLPQLMWFIAMSGLCLFIHWWYYNQLTGALSIPRTYAIVAIVLTTFLCGAFVPCMRIRPSRLLIPTQVDHVVNESNRQTAMLPLQRRLKVSPGRPLPSDVVATVAKSENPGAIFCGPSTLRTSIKKLILKERRRIRGSYHIPCAIYDEQSEM